MFSNATDARLTSERQYFNKALPLLSRGSRKPVSSNTTIKVILGSDLHLRPFFLLFFVFFFVKENQS